MSAAADEPSAEDGAEEAAQNSAAISDGISNKKHLCSHCGIVVIATKTAHEKGHERSEGFSCAICGVFYGCAGRNYHELHVHHFKRTQADEGVSGAVKISKSQLHELVNVGFKLAEVQATAPAFTALQTEDATVEELLALMKENPQDRQLVCPVCKVHSSDRLGAERHLAAHHSAARFVCSLCGVHYAKSRARNQHEQKMHGFDRHEHDGRREEAIRIAPDQWTLYSQPGTNIEQVQAGAVESHANARPELLDSSNVNAESQVLPRAVKRENRRHTVANPLLSASPARAVRKRSAVDVIQLDDSDDEQPQASNARPTIGLHLPPPLPVPLPAAPLLHPPPVVQQPATPAPAAIPVAASSSTSNNQTVGEERSAVRLMTALTAKPRVVYYDHKELSADFNVLPVRWWASARESSLLLVRSGTTDWSGNVPLPLAAFRFSLADQFGDILCFAKPMGAAAADRLRRLVASELSFADLMAAVQELGFPSVLIVAGDADRATVRHMSCPEFLVL